MNWYKVWIVVPGTDGDAENGPCEPTWWNDFVKASSMPEAIKIANAKCKENFEEVNEFGFCEKEMGGYYPVCILVQKKLLRKSTKPGGKKWRIFQRCPLCKYVDKV